MDKRLRQFEKYLFWDVNMQNLDMDKHKKFIVERVVDRGDKKDVMFIWHYYGVKTIKDILTHAKYLDNKTIHFFANQFGIALSEFRAYRLKEKHKPLWAH